MLRTVRNLITLMAVVLATAQTQAQVISVSFAGDNAGQAANFNVATDVAGVVPVANWNSDPNQLAAGTINGLVNDSGANSGANVTWSGSNNVWGGVPGDPATYTENDWLINGWLDDNGDGATVQVTDIPFDNYDVYVYGSTDGAGNAGRGWRTFVTNDAANFDAGALSAEDFLVSGGAFTNVNEATGSFYDASVGFVDASTDDPDPDFFRIGGLSGSDLIIYGRAGASPDGRANRGSISGFQIVENNNPEPTVSINRDTGEITIDNVGGAFDFTGYTLTSTAGGLSEDGFASLDGFTTATSSNTELSETGNGSVPADGSLTIGTAWRQSPFEDVRFSLLDSNGDSVNSAVTFTGNGGARYATGDFNFDGTVNTDDWPTVRDGFNANIADSLAVDGYLGGDITADGAVDVADLLEFEQIFDAANGAGAFAAAVPEPGTLALLAMGAVSLLGFRKRRGLVVVALMMASTVMLTTNETEAAPLPIENGSFELANLAPGGWTNCIDVICDEAVDPEFWNDADGVGDLNAGGVFGEHIDGFSLDGTHHVGLAAGRRVTQTLSGVELLPNSVYTLTLGVGNRSPGFTPEGNQSAFGLSVGGVDLDLAIFDASTLDEASFSETTYTYVTGGSPPTGDISIVLASIGEGRAHYDHVRGDVSPIGMQDLLRVEVDRGTGAVTLTNNGATDRDIDYYELRSASGSINLNGWDSLEAQDFEGNGAPGNGNGWEELGNLDSNVAAEFYLQGSSVITDAMSVSLGNAFSLGGEEDWTFSYQLEGQGAQSGLVEYVGEAGAGLLCDFDGDGDCDQTDINTLYGNDGDINQWLSQASAADGSNEFVLGDANLDGDVNSTDLGLLLNNFNGAGDAAATWAGGDLNDSGNVDSTDLGLLLNNFNFTSASNAAVPEPNAGVLLLVGLVGLLRRRK